MTMVGTAYRTKTNTSDHAITQTLVARFSGQPKGWWDHYLNELYRNNIIYVVRKNNDGIVIKGEDGLKVQDVIPTLIFAIAKHFIGDSSKLKARSSEIFANLRCKKFKILYGTKIFSSLM